MLNPKEFRKKSTNLFTETNELLNGNVENIFIAEQEGVDPEEYIDPQNILIKLKNPEMFPAGQETRKIMNGIKEFYKTAFDDVGVAVSFVHDHEAFTQTQNPVMQTYSKHLLDSAIPILEVNDSISWQQQFENKLQSKKRPREEERHSIEESDDSRVKRDSSLVDRSSSGKSSSSDSDDSAATQFLDETREVREKMRKLHPSVQAKVLQIIGQDCGLKVIVEKDMSLKRLSPSSRPHNLGERSASPLVAVDGRSISPERDGK